MTQRYERERTTTEVEDAVSEDPAIYNEIRLWVRNRIHSCHAKAADAQLMGFLESVLEHYDSNPIEIEMDEWSPSESA